jgi:polysaccharide export outer membrane protein
LNLLNTPQSFTNKVILLAWIALTVSANINGQKPTPDTHLEGQSETELIHFGDLVDVDVVGSFEYDWRGTLTPEGFLDGLERSEQQIYALCRSEQEVAANIAREYAKTLRDPNVVVKIVDRSNRAAAILYGAVKSPQRFQIRRSVKLNELLALSGGITESASGTILIFRPGELNCIKQTGENGLSKEADRELSSGSTVSIRIKDLLGGKPEANPEILSGDIVTVADAPPIYVMGAVNNPGQLASRSGIRLSQAISEAGGATKSAREVTIYRRGSGGSAIIQTDLKKVSSGESDDLELKAFDVVDVMQKGDQKRKLLPKVPASTLFASGVFRLPMRVID